MYFMNCDLERLLLGFLTLLLGTDRLDRSRDKEGIGRVLACLAGLVFLLSSALFFFTSLDFGVDEDEEDEEGEEA